MLVQEMSMFMSTLQMRKNHGDRGQLFTFTEKWDVGPGEASSFPTKWMSADGKTCYLVFSGDDAFSVRKVSFVISERKN